MKILWLSPWMRPLARVHVEALQSLGHDVLLVTTDQHPESGPARDYEVVLDARVKRVSTWGPFFRALQRIRSFGPDVVVSELVRDPRWIAFGALGTRVHLVHDDRPHDASENRPFWERTLFDRWAHSSAATVTFSEYVADAVRSGRVPGAPSPVHVVPLTSDLGDATVPPLAPSSDRRDFVLLGRINSYKNIDVVLDAWRRHVGGTHWRGDNLVVIGKGTIDRPLPPHTIHRNRAFRYEDELSTISRAKASLVHYRRASQSGVQVLSMQLGVATVISDRGALPEFRAPGDPAISVDDIDSLVREFDRLSDPDVAFARGRAARTTYRERFRADVAGRNLHRFFSELCGLPTANYVTPDCVEPVVPETDVELR